LTPTDAAWAQKTPETGGFTAFPGLKIGAKNGARTRDPQNHNLQPDQ